MEDLNKANKKMLKSGTLGQIAQLVPIRARVLDSYLYFGHHPDWAIKRWSFTSVDLSNNMIYFIKQQFIVGLRLPIPSLKQFIHFT